MAIPAPLAFPPTALRNISAGLVVGNPVGSSGTRAKALTSAELKAIVEASGISYLPLAGGTLTGPITGTGGLIEQRDGLTAQCLDIFEIYTSGTNNGKLRLKATSSGHQIGSARATSGSNRALQFGHFDSAGAFTVALDIATNGTLMSNSSMYLGSGNVLEFNSLGIGITQFGQIGFSNSSNAGGTKSTRLTQLSAGWLRIGTSADLAAGSLLCKDLILSPAASVTLSTNSQFSIEMTSNTAGNLVYRGSDGTTRRMALTFS